MAAEAFAALTLARLLRPWGRRGEVAAEILTDSPKRLTELRQVWLADGRQPPRHVNIRSCRIHLGQALFLFENIDSITDAERLRGLEVQVPFSERAPLKPGRHYIADLVGCSVWESGAATELGTVRGLQQISEAGPASAESWVLEVATAQGELLIPLAVEICTQIDTAAKRIEVRLPEGLRAVNAR